MIKSQYIRSFGIVSFYYDRSFTVLPHSDEGVDLFPNDSDHQDSFVILRNLREKENE